MKEKSKTFQSIKKLNYLLKIIFSNNTNIWNGFKGLGNDHSIIANCLNQPHDENEMLEKIHLIKNLNIIGELFFIIIN